MKTRIPCISCLGCGIELSADESRAPFVEVRFELPPCTNDDGGTPKFVTLGEQGARDLVAWLVRRFGAGILPP